MCFSFKGLSSSFPAFVTLARVVLWLLSVLDEVVLEGNWILSLIGPMTAASLLEITNWTPWNETCHAQQSSWLPVTSGNSWKNWTRLTDRLKNQITWKMFLSLPSFAASRMLMALGRLSHYFLMEWWSCINWPFIKKWWDSL